MCTGVIVDNDDMSTGMEKKEIMNTSDIFLSREPIMGPKGTKENPAVIPSFNSSRCVGLETEQVPCHLPKPGRASCYTCHAYRFLLIPHGCRE